MSLKARDQEQHCYLSSGPTTNETRQNENEIDFCPNSRNSIDIHYGQRDLSSVINGPIEYLRGRLEFSRTTPLGKLANVLKSACSSLLFTKT